MNLKEDILKSLENPKDSCLCHKFQSVEKLRTTMVDILKEEK